MSFISNIFDISQCNIAEMIGESNRFLFHVFLVHISSCIIEGRSNFFGSELFRTLIVTAIAIVMYHIFFKKIMDPKVETMKLICYDKATKNKKKKKLNKYSKKKQDKSDSEYISSEYISDG